MYVARLLQSQKMVQDALLSMLYTVSKAYRITWEPLCQVAVTVWVLQPLKTLLQSVLCQAAVIVCGAAAA